MFNALPLELITEIFSLCLPDPELESHIIDKRLGPVLLTQICSEWRRIAVSIPKLWSAFSINLRLVQDTRHLAYFADAWLARSGNGPLDLAMTGKLRRTVDGVNFKVDDGIGAFLATLKTFSRRIRCIRLSLSPPDLLKLDEQGFEMPMLEELEILMPTENPSLSHLPLTSFGSSPRLEKLTLDSLLLRPVSVGLEHILEFTAHGYSVPQHSTDALSMLPNLLSFEVEDYGRDVELDSPVEHPTLEVLGLTLAITSRDIDSTLLESLTLPDLMDLRLGSPIAVAPALEDFLRRSSWPPLEALYIVPSKQEAPLSTEVLARLGATLEDLTVAFPHKDSLEALCDKLGSDVAFLPNLRELSVSCWAVTAETGTADIASTLSTVAEAILRREALEPVWALRSLEVGWFNNDLVAPQLEPPHVPDKSLEAFLALRNRGVDVFVGRKASSDEDDSDLTLFSSIV